MTVSASPRVTATSHRRPTPALAPIQPSATHLGHAPLPLTRYRWPVTRATTAASASSLAPPSPWVAAGRPTPTARGARWRLPLTPSPAPAPETPGATYPTAPPRTVPADDA